MGSRNKTGLERGRREINALVEHGMEKAIEALLVAAHDLPETVDNRLASEKEAEHAADLVGRKRNTGFRSPFSKTIDEIARFFTQAFEKAGNGNQLQSLQSCRHGHRIAGQSPGLIHGTERSQFFHDVTPSAESANRHAAADDFAERSQIGRYAVMCLGSA